MIVGYTTGVFDLFHVGHLALLSRARSHCDLLIVGVTTDELSTQEKGKSPVIPYTERAAIVGALRCVDAVVPQESYEKLDAWRRLEFSIMFVGDDHKNTEKWKRIEEKMGGVGVKVVYLPYTSHVSSTILRQRLAKEIKELE
jgi:glycerol-3-phosphate cytidylyltransferase